MDGAPQEFNEYSSLICQKACGQGRRDLIVHGRRRRRIVDRAKKSNGFKYHKEQINSLRFIESTQITGVPVSKQVSSAMKGRSSPDWMVIFNPPVGW